MSISKEQRAHDLAIMTVNINYQNLVRKQNEFYQLSEEERLLAKLGGNDIPSSADIDLYDSYKSAYFSALDRLNKDEDFN